MNALIFAAIINAFTHAGVNGEQGVISDPDSTIRTVNGTDWTFASAFMIDDLAAAQDHFIIGFKRTSNDHGNHWIKWDTGGNGVCYVYDGVEIVCTSAILPDIWYLAALTYDEVTDTVILYVYTLPGGALHQMELITPTGSQFDDAQAQTPEIGGWEEAGVVTLELDGFSILQIYLDDYAATMSEIAAYATNPLLQGDLFLSTHATHVGFWFDNTTVCPSTCSDATGTETLTLVGGLTLGTANGPDIPARSGGGPGGSELLLRRSILGE